MIKNFDKIYIFDKMIFVYMNGKNKSKIRRLLASNFKYMFGQHMIKKLLLLHNKCNKNKNLLLTSYTGHHLLHPNQNKY